MMFTSSVLSLLSSISRIIADNYDKENRKLKSQADRKLRMIIDKKEQELEIKTISQKYY